MTAWAMGADSLNVAEVARAAAAAAREHALECLGVLTAGGSHYVEILLRHAGARPSLIALGVFRDVSEAQLRSEISRKLRRLLSPDPPPS